jgi:hypothetical protein
LTWINRHLHRFAFIVAARKFTDRGAQFVTDRVTSRGRPVGGIAPSALPLTQINYLAPSA